MLITFPTACKTRMQQWTLTAPMQRNRSAWTGREKRLSWGGARWSVQAEMVPMKLATWQAFQSFIAQTEGGLNTFQFYATPATQSGPASATWAMWGDGQVANYLTYSEQFDNAAWGALFTASVTANSVAAPDGSMTADTFNFSGATNASIYQDTTTAAVGSTPYTFSVWLYGTAGQTVSLQLTTTAGSGTVTAAKTLTASWARYDVTTTMPGSPSGNLRVFISRNTTGTATTFYAWGAQVNIGSTAAPYIPTTSAVAIGLNSLRVTGLTVSATNLSEGQLLTVGDRLYAAVAPVVADSAGNAIVAVKPNLAALTTSTSIAYVQRPYAVVALTDAPSYTLEPGSIYRVSFSAEEVF